MAKPFNYISANFTVQAIIKKIIGTTAETVVTWRNPMTAIEQTLHWKSLLTWQKSEFFIVIIIITCKDFDVICNKIKNKIC